GPCLLGDHIAERVVSLRAFMGDQELLGDMLGLDDRLAHPGHTLSAKDRSVLRKYFTPTTTKARETTTDKKNPGQYIGSPQMHQRKPSMTATAGFREYQKRALCEYFCAITALL